MSLPKNINCPVPNTATWCKKRRGSLSQSSPSLTGMDVATSKRNAQRTCNASQMCSELFVPGGKQPKNTSNGNLTAPALGPISDGLRLEMQRKLDSLSLLTSGKQQNKSIGCVSKPGFTQNCALSAGLRHHDRNRWHSTQSRTK